MPLLLFVEQVVIFAKTSNECQRIAEITMAQNNQ